MKKEVQVERRFGKFQVSEKREVNLSYMKLTRAIEELQNVLNEVVAAGDDDGHLYIDHYEEYGSTYTSTYVSFYRNATPEEIEAHLEKEKNLKLTIEERERKQFEELKKKYG